MKTYFPCALFALVLNVAPALAQAGTFLECQDILLYQQEDNGSGQLVSTGVSVSVRTSANAPYGWEAELKHNGQSYVEQDVKAEVLLPDTVADQLQEIIEGLELNIPWSSVDRLHYADVGVKANRDDAAGIKIFELLDKAGSTLGQIATYGWGFGICEPKP